MVEIGETIAGRYQLRRRLGQGPLAEVFLAYDERLHSLFALKLLRQDLAADPAFLKRFRQMLAATQRWNTPTWSAATAWSKPATTLF